MTNIRNKDENASSPAVKKYHDEDSTRTSSTTTAAAAAAAAATTTTTTTTTTHNNNKVCNTNHAETNSSKSMNDRKVYDNDNGIDNANANDIDNDIGNDIGNDNGFNPRLIHTHYLILIHGWLGNAKDMSYFATSIDKSLLQDDKNRTTSLFQKNKVRVKVHSSTCNTGKTSDGIAKGGQRLSNEIHDLIRNDVIDDYIKNNNGDGQKSIQEDHDDVIDNEDVIHVSLSLVGHSLGGLYARHAIACLPQEMEVELPSPTASTTDEGIDKSITNAKKFLSIKVHFNTFVSTASPHLGILSTKRKFCPIGRFFGQTGKDLFLYSTHERYNNHGKHNHGIIFEMATNYDTFLHPLTKFHRRIAYANAFRTDFQVPTPTAAFLSNRSNCPHFIVQKHMETKDFVVAKCMTKMNRGILLKANDNVIGRKRIPVSIKDEFMSQKLDALGWTKVFVDCRPLNPIKSIRKLCTQNSRETWDEFVMEQSSNSKRNMQQQQQQPTPINSLSLRLMTAQSSNDNDSGINFDKVLNSDSSTMPPSSLHNKSMVEVKSHELFSLMNRNERIHIPVGHALLIANSKNEIIKRFNASGQHIVDHIACELLHDLLAFQI